MKHEVSICVDRRSAGLIRRSLSGDYAAEREDASDSIRRTFICMESCPDEFCALFSITADGVLASDAIAKEVQEAYADYAVAACASPANEDDSHTFSWKALFEALEQPGMLDRLKERGLKIELLALPEHESEETWRRVQSVSVILSNIEWDTDGEAVPELPDTVSLSGADPGDDLADILSDRYGFLVKGYVVQSYLEEVRKMHSYHLTENGKQLAESYIAELEAKRKEILDAGKDTADETALPGLSDIENDIAFAGVNWDDPDGPCYYNGWGVTDNYEADYPLRLNYGRDFVVGDTAVYEEDSYIEMVPGMIVQDLCIKSLWKVLSNDGTSVALRNLSGGSNGVKIEVKKGYTNGKFLLLDNE